MNFRIKILWNVLCRPGSTFSRRLSDAAERMDSRDSEFRAPDPAAANSRFQQQVADCKGALKNVSPHPVRQELVSRRPIPDVNAGNLETAVLFSETTDKTRTDEQLRQKVALMRIAGRMTTTGGWVFSLSDEHLVWSDEVFAILDFPLNHVPKIADILARYIDPLGAPVAMDACVREGTPFDLEVEIFTATNRRIWVRVCGEAERDPHGEIRQVQGAFGDITGRKLSEQSSARQENELRVLFDLMPAMIWFKDTDDGILRVNQRAADAVGLSIEEIEGKPSGLIYPENWARHHADDLEVICSGDPKLGIVEILQNSAGDEIWVQTDKIPVRNKDGQIVGIVVMSQDVSARKLAEQALRESEDKFRLLADNLTDAFWIRSADMKTLHYLSAGYERIWGRPVAHLHQNPHTWTDSIVPDDRERIRAVFTSLMSEASQVSVEYRIVRPDGEVRWVHARGFQVRDAAGELLSLTGIVTDITERREAEVVFREQSALLASAQRIGRMGSWRMDHRGNRLIWSEATCELFGIVTREFSGTFEFFLSFIVEEDLPAFEAVHDLISPSNPVWEAEYRIRWRDGTVHWMYERGVAEFDAMGGEVSWTGMVMDATERKVSEEKLRQSLSLLRIAGSIAGVGGWSVNVADNEIYWSEEVWNLLGFPGGKEPSLEVALNMYFPESRDKIAAALASCSSAGTSFDLDLELNHAKGQKMWVRVCGEAARDADGKITKVQGAFSDITSRRKAQEALHQSEQEFRALAESMPQMVWKCRPDGWNVYFNQRWVSYTGLTLEESCGNGWSLPFHPDDRSRAEEAWKNATEKGAKYSLEVRLRDHRNDYRWFLVRGVAQRDETGSTLWWYGTCTDIDDLKEAEKAALKSEQGLRDLTAQLESEQARLVNAQSVAKLGSWETDLSTGKVHWSAETYRIFEVAPDQFRPTHDGFLNLVHPDDRVAVDESFVRSANQLSACALEHRLLLADGRIKFIEERWQIIRNEQHEPVRAAGTAQDITDRRQAQAEREKMHRQLVEVSRQAGMAEVATNVLHNVGNVLNSVNISCSVITDKFRKSRIGSVAKTAELLQSQTGNMAAFFDSHPAGQKLPEYLGKLAGRLAEEHTAISAELRSLSGNIDHIKDIVAMQQNYARVSGVVEIIDIADLIKHALRMCGEALSRHNVKVVGEYEKVPPAAAEKAKVLQILVNLFSNAKSACHESGRSDRQMTLRLTAEGRTARIEVMDNGVGISPENLTRIFAHGFTTRTDGHGFGLHGSVLAAREMGGDLTVQSDGPGHGAVFTLELPLAVGPTQ